MSVRFTLNGAPVSLEAPGSRRLIDVLRENLRLTGTKEGCGEGECGACTVILDGDPVNSCLIPVVQVEGGSVYPVEPRASPDTLGRLQKAFLGRGGAQWASARRACS